MLDDPKKWLIEKFHGTRAWCIHPRLGGTMSWNIFCVAPSMPTNRVEMWTTRHISKRLGFKFVTNPNYYQSERFPSSELLHSVKDICLVPYTLLVDFELLSYENKSVNTENPKRRRVHTCISVADEFHNKFNNVVQRSKSLRNKVLFVRFSSRVRHYANKIVYRNRVTNSITLTVSLLCSTQPR